MKSLSRPLYCLLTLVDAYKDMGCVFRSLNVWSISGENGGGERDQRESHSRGDTICISQDSWDMDDTVRQKAKQ